MSDSLISEVAAIRKRDVDAYITRKLNQVRGDVTGEEIEEWEREGYRRWRAKWPTLNDLLIPHAVEVTS